MASRIFVTGVLIFFVHLSPVAEASKPKPPTEVSQEEMVTLGRRLFKKGGPPPSKHMQDKMDSAYPPATPTPPKKGAKK